MGSSIILLLLILVVVPKCTNSSTYITSSKNRVRRIFAYVGCIEGYIQYFVVYSAVRERESLLSAADS